MGSLPELRRLGGTTPSPPPQASSRHTHNGPRYSVGAATTFGIRKSFAPRPPLNTEAMPSIQLTGGRRRESCSSSVGATSVRRLVRTRTLGGRGALATPESATLRAAAIACCSRAFAAAALLPLQVLQGAHGLWSPGPPLLTSLHAVSTGTALLSPALMHLTTIRNMMPTTYFIFAVFFVAHLYPKVYVLVPIYIAAGACWSPLALAHKSLLVALSEGTTMRNGGGANGGVVVLPARSALLRRFSRGSRAARDLGLLLAAILLPLLPTVTDMAADRQMIPIANSTDCAIEFDGRLAPCSAKVFQNGSGEPTAANDSVAQNMTTIWSKSEFDEESELWRENWCGARGCPSQEDAMPGGGDGVAGLDEAGGPLAVTLCILCALAAICSMTLPSMDSSAGPAPWRAPLAALAEPRLRFVGPLSFFIGLEQGFLYAHLMQWYIVCVSGGGQQWRTLIGVALLRALVACTLSMLLAHGRRKLVIVVGLVWHSCLLLALSMWRAAHADKQLPTVMAAAWAGCDAVWELVLSTTMDDPWCVGLSALSQCFRSLGLTVSFMMRWLFCVRWTLFALMLSLPAAAIPMFFTADDR